jgi:endonuclease YncB( thermonuclease family)
MLSKNFLNKSIGLISSVLLLNVASAAVGGGTKPDLRLTVDSVQSIYDGDTFRAFVPGYEKDQPIRVRGVDTPEIRGQCSKEIQAAIVARDFVRGYLRSAIKIELVDVGRDRYQRILATVIVDGQDLAQTLIDKKLGRKWRGKREKWCR